MATGAGTTQYAYDAADRLTSITPPGASAVSYGWDDNGNLASRGSDSFSWDAEDRLTSATVSSTTTTFAYNGDGLRDSLTTGGNTTTFTWDVNRSIPQVLDDEDFRYVYGIGRIAQVSGSGTHYYLSDGLGSTMALTDEAGAVVNDYDYDVFGALRDSSGSQANDFTFASEQVDSGSGLQYLRARYYDPATGRFLSRDGYSGFPALPGTQNRYAYSGNNPVLYADPNGDNPLAVCFVLLAVGGGGSLVCYVIVAAVLAGGYCVATDCMDSDSFRDAVKSLIGLLDKLLGPEDEDETAPSYEGGFDAGSFEIPSNPADPPGEGWEWRGTGPVGSNQGAWYNPETGESLHPDLGHADPIGPHWDYRDPDGRDWRIFPDGRMEPK